MGKRYLIVGGSSGIGAAIVSSLQNAGDTCIDWSRRSPADGRDGTDVRNDASLPALEGALDGLVYCPGSINLKPFGRLTRQDFNEDMEINLYGAIRVIQHVLPNLKQADSASVVLFSTVAVQSGMAFHASVAAAKGAVEGLTRSLAAEFAPKIRFNCIAPSLTDTPLAEKLLNTDEKKANGAMRHPLKKTGTAEDIAAMAEFLLSDKSTWITGQILHVDGGLSSIR